MLGGRDWAKVCAVFSYKGTHTSEENKVNAMSAVEVSKDEAPVSIAERYTDRVRVLRHPLALGALARLRDEQTSVGDFRRALTEAGLILGVEAMNSLKTRSVRIKTPLAETDGVELEHQPVFVPVLRAGVGFVDAMLQLAPEAAIAMIGMARDHDTLKAVEYYRNFPHDFKDRPIFIIDPMLATANTAKAVVAIAREAGAKDIKVISLVAAPEGVEALMSFDDSVELVTAAVDECLNDQAYIVPGLGDAGDRIFGT